MSYFAVVLLCWYFLFYEFNLISTNLIYILLVLFPSAHQFVSFFLFLSFIIVFIPVTHLLCSAFQKTC